MSGEVLIEGAIDSELDALIARFKPARALRLGGWQILCDMAGGENIALIKTKVGVANAAAATALAVSALKPRAVISQGTAGAHDINLHTGDIIIGEKLVRLGAYKSRAARGINPLNWQPLTLEGDAGAGEALFSDERLVALAQARLAGRQSDSCAGLCGRVARGVIGSGDVWNCEADMISHLNVACGTACEEMETFAAAQVCVEFGVPFLALRVISNNERLGESYAPEVAGRLQALVADVALGIIESDAN